MMFLLTFPFIYLYAQGLDNKIPQDQMDSKLVNNRVINCDPSYQKGALWSENQIK